MKIHNSVGRGFAALAILLAGNTYGVDYHWTGGGGDGLWANPANWDNGVPPNTSGNVTLDPQAGGASMTIVAGENENPALNTTYGTIFGPEWGATLNIYGSLNYNWYLAPVQNNAANPSTINMYGNSSISGEGIALGYNWWWNAGPYVTMNLYGNSTVKVNYLFWGGHLNLDGGTFKTANGVNDGNSDLVSDATRLMDITAGQLILGNGDQTALVNSWISRGILEAYGGTGHIVIDTTSMPGSTIVSAVPEPSGLLLIGLGGLALAPRRRC